MSADLPVGRMVFTYLNSWRIFIQGQAECATGNHILKVEVRYKWCCMMPFQSSSAGAMCRRDCRSAYYGFPSAKTLAGRGMGARTQSRNDSDRDTGRRPVHKPPPARRKCMFHFMVPRSSFEECRI